MLKRQQSRSVIRKNERAKEKEQTRKNDNKTRNKKETLATSPLLDMIWKLSIGHLADLVLAYPNPILYVCLRLKGLSESGTLTEYIHDIGLDLTYHIDFDVNNLILSEEQPAPKNSNEITPDEYKLQTEILVFQLDRGDYPECGAIVLHGTLFSLNGYFGHADTLELKRIDNPDGIEHLHSDIIYKTARQVITKFPL